MQSSTDDTNWQGYPTGYAALLAGRRLGTAVNPRTRWSFPRWPQPGQKSAALKAGQLFGLHAATAVGKTELSFFAPSEAMRGKWEQALADRGPGLPLALSALYSLLSTYGNGVVTTEEMLAHFAAIELAYLCHGGLSNPPEDLSKTYLSADWLLARRKLREADAGELEEAIADLAREAIGDEQVSPELERRRGIVSSAVSLVAADQVADGAAHQQLLRLDPYTGVMDDFRRVAAEELEPRLTDDRRPLFWVGFDTQLLLTFPDVDLSEPKGLFIRQLHAEMEGHTEPGRSLTELFRQLRQDWKQAASEGSLRAQEFGDVDWSRDFAKNRYGGYRAAIVRVTAQLSTESRKYTASRSTNRLVANLERRVLSQLGRPVEGSAVATGEPPRGTIREAARTIENASAQRAVPASKAASVFRKEANTWALAFEGGKQAHLADLKGMHYIAQLIRAYAERKDKIEVAGLSCQQLIGAYEGHQVTHQGKLLKRTNQKEWDGLERSGLSSSRDEDQIDKEGLRDYRRRLDDIGDELDQAEKDNDIGKQDSLRLEREQLRGELKHSFGLSGRSRPMPGASDKARKAVKECIDRAIEKIRKPLPLLHKHLINSIRTGGRCRYDPRSPVKWDVDPGSP